MMMGAGFRRKTADGRKGCTVELGDRVFSLLSSETKLLEALRKLLGSGIKVGQPLVPSHLDSKGSTTEDHVVLRKTIISTAMSRSTTALLQSQGRESRTSH